MGAARGSGGAGGECIIYILAIRISRRTRILVTVIGICGGDSQLGIGKSRVGVQVGIGGWYGVVSSVE